MNAISFGNNQKLEDHWAGIAPFGFTRDGKIAPADALDDDGDSITASNWDEADFYTPKGEIIGSFPNTFECMIFTAK